jgi:hypothetical protein
MATFCHFWRITPAEFWDLDLPEYHAMLRLMEKHKEDADRTNRRTARRKR